MPNCVEILSMGLPETILSFELIMVLMISEN